MTAEPATTDPARLACDAMCGGLARWLRALGHDAAYVPGIEDGDLVQLARDESRIVISSDTRLFHRRVFTDGSVRGLFLPHGLRRLRQVEYVVRRLGLPCLTPRCMRCNGVLDTVDRATVADRVPARSLLWATEFYTCRDCGKVYWNGSHWRKIEAIRTQAQEWGGGGS